MPSLAISQTDIVNAVVAERRDKGNATVRALAARLGRSVGATQTAIERAVEAGVLLKDSTAGSVRPAPIGEAAFVVSLEFRVDQASGRPLEVRLV